VETVGNGYWIVEEIVQAGCVLNCPELLISMQKDPISFTDGMLLTVWYRSRRLGTRKSLLGKFQQGPLAIGESLGMEIAFSYARILRFSTGSTRDCPNASRVKNTTLEVP